MSITLRQIGTAIELYARENRGAFPPSFEVLMVQQDLPASTFICRHSGHTPATGPTCQVAARRMATVPGHCSYVYLAAGRKTTTVRATEIVAYEPPGTHSAPGMAALFGDGHTEWLDATAAATALAQVNAGVSPVCLPPAPTPTRRIAQ